MSWNLAEEVGGEETLAALIREFYDLLFEDVLVGFLFQPHDKERLITSQIAYLKAHLGDRSGVYDGPTIRRAHEKVPILPGHFDRRHKVLTDLLERWNVPEHVKAEWLTLDQSLRQFVVNLGATRRGSLLEDSDP